MIDLEKFTRKSQEAVQAAAESAESHGNPAIEPEHIVLEVLRQDDGIVPRVLAAMGVQAQAVAGVLERKIENFPQVSGGGVKVNASPGLVRLLREAEKQARSMGDDFVSTEHFVLAAFHGAAPDIEKVFEQNGARPEAFTEALKQMRGNQRVTDDNPEAKFDALKKYARDLTTLAEEGKLDPVVGRGGEPGPSAPGSFPDRRGW